MSTAKSFTCAARGAERGGGGRGGEKRGRQYKLPLSPPPHTLRYRVFVRVAQVHRLAVIAVHEADQAIDQVVHELEGARLLAGPGAVR